MANLGGGTSVWGRGGGGGGGGGGVFLCMYLVGCLVVLSFSFPVPDVPVLHALTCSIPTKHRWSTVIIVVVLCMYLVAWVVCQCFHSLSCTRCTCAACIDPGRPYAIRCHSAHAML